MYILNSSSKLSYEGQEDKQYFYSREMWQSFIPVHPGLIELKSGYRF